MVCSLNLFTFIKMVCSSSIHEILHDIIKTDLKEMQRFFYHYVQDINSSNLSVHDGFLQVQKDNGPLLLNPPISISNHLCMWLYFSHKRIKKLSLKANFIELFQYMVGDFFRHMFH